MKAFLIFIIIAGLSIFIGIQAFGPHFRFTKMELDTINFVKQNTCVTESFYFTAGEKYEKRNQDRLREVKNFVTAHAAELGVAGEIKDVSVDISRTNLPMSPGDIKVKVNWSDSANFLVYHKPYEHNVEFTQPIPAAMVSGSTRRLPVPDRDDSR